MIFYGLKRIKKSVKYVEFKLTMLSYKYKLCIIFLFLLFFYKTVYADIHHIVKKGETLYKISKNYDVPVEDIIDNNAILDITAIQVGSVLLIPRKNTISMNIEQKKKRESKEGYYSYVVIKGDTLFKISKRFNVKISTLKNINNLSSETLYINQKISIPSDVLYNNTVTEREKEYTHTANARDIIVDLGEKEEHTYTIPYKEDISNFIDILTMVANTKDNNSRIVYKDWPITGRLYETKGILPGIIIEGDENTSVKALKSGKVMYAALHSSFNNVIVIKGNDGSIYLYGGQKELYVKQGDTIVEGQKIGILGVMPTIKRAILYFSVWQNNRYIDPNSIFG